MQFHVSVHNIFDAESPEDAVRQMVAFLDDYAALAGYVIQNIDTDEVTYIDAELLDII